MKYIIPLLLSVSPISAENQTSAHATLQVPEISRLSDDSQSAYSSYLGTYIALQLLKNDVTLQDIDIASFFQALEDGMNDGTDIKQQLARKDIPAHLNRQSETRRQQLAEEAKKIGEQFLAVNGKKPGVTTTASGLQYRIDRQGTGTSYNKKQHGTNPTYTVKYTVRTLNGTVVSDFTDETVEAADHSRLEGFDEGLSLMPVGSQWTFFLPSHLAFGDEHIVTASSMLPANSALIIQVELFGIKKGDETQTMYIEGVPFEFIPMDADAEETETADEE